MQEQLLEKCVHGYPVSDPNLSRHHYFQYCKQQTGISLCFLWASAPLSLSHFAHSLHLCCCSPNFSCFSSVTLFHFIRCPFTSCGHTFLRLWLLFLFLHCPISLLFSNSVPAQYSSTLHPFAEPGELQKMVIAGESGGVSLELGAAVVCSAKHFPSWRWRIPFDEKERHKDYLGRRKEKTPHFVALHSSLSFPEEEDFRKFLPCEMLLCKYLLWARHVSLLWQCRTATLVLQPLPRNFMM